VAVAINYAFGTLGFGAPSCKGSREALPLAVVGLDRIGNFLRHGEPLGHANGFGFRYTSSVSHPDLVEQGGRS
jgi:hypothetical protein